MNHDTLVAGATGLIGRELVDVLRDQPEVHRLHLLLRRPVALSPGSTALIVDFAHLPPLPAARDAYCALGTTIAVAGSQAAFRAVDFDAVLAFARAARAAGTRRFAVVSALGANARSRTFYNRVKGEMEVALRAVGFETLVIAQPSLLAGDRASLGQPQRVGERLALALTAPLMPLLPKGMRPIHAATVARAMVKALATLPPGQHTLVSGALQDLGRAPGR